MNSWESSAQTLSVKTEEKEIDSVMLTAHDKFADILEEIFIL